MAHIPPLRERREDILPLAKYFIERYAAKAGQRIRRVDERTAQLLETYPWPGNIRELQNVIEQTVILCETETFSVDEEWFHSESEPILRTSKPASQEKQTIEAALEESRGRTSGPCGAAARLGIPRTTLEGRIKRLTINKYKYQFAARQKHGQ